METYGLTEKAVDVVLALCDEAGEDISDEQYVLEGFTANHSAEDINAAAEGDVAALIALRTACGLPIFV